MKKRKISIIGAGNVGTTVAQRLAEEEIGDLVLLDIESSRPSGKALDLMQAGPVMGYDTSIKGTADYKDIAGSDIVVITSGMPRKPGMSRDDLLKVNFEIVRDVTTQIKESSPGAIIIVVSNPLDAMTYTAYKYSGFSRDRVVGMAGILDTARFKTFIAMELNVSVKSINAFVLGGHGDTMVPILKYTTVAGRPLTDILSAEKTEKLVQRTRDGGAEIVSLLQTGSAYYAPSAAVVAMVKSILFDKKEIFSCAALLDGEFGVKGLFVGVPVKLGLSGVEEIVEISLDEKEKKAFDESVSAVRKTLVKIESF